MDKESVTAAPARGRRESCISGSGSSGFASISPTTTTTTTSGSVHQAAEVRWRGSSHASPSQHLLQLQVEGPYVPLQPSAQARTARGTAASRASVGSHGNWRNNLSHAVTLFRFRDLGSCAHRGAWDGTIRTQRRTASVTSQSPLQVCASCYRCW